MRSTCCYGCRSLRLSLPLIKTAALLITHASFAGVSVPASAADMQAAAAASTNTGDKQPAVVGTTCSFAWGVLQLLKQELRGCSDVSKLLEGAALMAQLACIGDCSASAIQSVMVLLVNRFPKVCSSHLVSRQRLAGNQNFGREAGMQHVLPAAGGTNISTSSSCGGRIAGNQHHVGLHLGGGKQHKDASSRTPTCLSCVAVHCPLQVRRHMAEQLYLQMLAVQAEADAASPEQQQSVFGDVPADDLEAALDVLLISPWDGPLDQARAGREELAGHLHIEIKTRRVAKASEGKGAAAELAPNAAEHESYQSLLDDAARGGGY
jgi:hypothetical protein